MTKVTSKEKIAEQVAEILQKQNPSPKTELIHENEYELAVAVMLSAQTTDKKVNQVTPALFEKYPNWKALAKAKVPDVQKLIKQVNFHKGKGERLVKAANFVEKTFGGVLPQDLLELTKIPGVARKSANVILNEVWNKAQGIVVDTHISRVSSRLGLTTNSDPKKIEQDLMKIIPKKYWRSFSGNMVLHGRYVCTAKKPKCDECVLNKICKSAYSFKV